MTKTRDEGPQPDVDRRGLGLPLHSCAGTIGLKLLIATGLSLLASVGRLTSVFPAFGGPLQLRGPGPDPLKDPVLGCLAAARTVYHHRVVCHGELHVLEASAHRRSSCAANSDSQVTKIVSSRTGGPARVVGHFAPGLICQR
jgi:hypothetical protein